MMATQLQIKEKAKREIRAVCDKLFEDGLSNGKKYSIRRVQELRKELFGQAGHQDLIKEVRDEWLREKGLFQPTAKPEVQVSHVDLVDNRSQTPWVQNAVESFLVEQKELIAQEVEKQFQDKIAALENALSQSQQRCQTLEESLTKEQEKAQLKQQQIDGFSGVVNSFVEKIEVLTEERTKAIQKVENVYRVEDELKQEKQAHEALKIKFNELHHTFKWQSTQLDEAEKQNTQLKQQNNKLKVEIRTLERTKEELSFRQQSATQELANFKDWHEEVVKEHKNQAKNTAKQHSKDVTELYNKIYDEFERLNKSAMELDSQRSMEQSKAFVELGENMKALKDNLRSELRQVTSDTRDLKGAIQAFKLEIKKNNL